jgi:hypothetical protein
MTLYTSARAETHETAEGFSAGLLKMRRPLKGSALAY